MLAQLEDGMTRTEPFTTNDAGCPTKRGVPIDLNALNKSYGQVKALHDITLQIGGGEFLTLLGPSGSGKSTLLMALAGFVMPSTGSIRFGGKEITDLPPHKRDIGVVFQNYALFPNMSVGENVAYPLRIRRLPKPEIQKRVKAALELIRLGNMMDRRIETLSGGQRQRVALARAVVFEPKVLLMDEPLSALDKNLRDHMQIEIRHLHQQLGITTIYVTHDQREALTLSDRIAVMNHGRILQIEKPRDLYERPRSRFVAEFIGEAKLLAARPDEGQRAWTYGGKALKTAANTPWCSAEKHYVVIRPEKLRLSKPDEAPERGINYFEATFGEAVYQGENLLITLTLSEGDEVMLRVPSDQKTVDSLPVPGGQVVIGLHANDTLIVPEGL